MGSAQPRACTHGPDGAPSPSSSPSAQGLLQTRAGGSEHTGPSASPCSEGRPRRHQHRRIGDICRAHHTQQTPSRGLQRLVRAGPQCASGACAACPQLARGHPAGELGWGVTLSPPTRSRLPSGGPGALEPHPPCGTARGGSAPLPDPGRPARNTPRPPRASPGRGPGSASRPAHTPTLWGPPERRALTACSGRVFPLPVCAHSPGGQSPSGKVLAWFPSLPSPGRAQAVWSSRGDDRSTRLRPRSAPGSFPDRAQQAGLDAPRRHPAPRSSPAPWL